MGGGAKLPGACVGGGAKAWVWSATLAAASPVPSAASGGGGVFSRCLIGSGAGGADGLYASGAKLVEAGSVPVVIGAPESGA